jgi:signal transduction histidine kinase
VYFYAGAVLVRLLHGFIREEGGFVQRLGALFGPKTSSQPPGQGAENPARRPAWVRPAQFIVLLATAVLVGLTWFGTLRAVDSHLQDAQARVDSELQGKALSVEEQLRRELLLVDQALRFMEADWERDPAGFGFDEWHGRMALLRQMAFQVFLTDEHGVIRESTRPEIIGNSVSGRDYFRQAAEVPADSGKMIIGKLARGYVTGQWQVNLARRLDRPDGSFAGIVALSYNADAFTRFLQEDMLGHGGIVAVIATSDGVVHALGDLALAGKVQSIAGSQLYDVIIEEGEGQWTGPSPFDGIVRVHAFATIPGRGLKVVVGVDREEALSAATRWNNNALVFAGGITALVVALAAFLLLEEHAVRRRHEASLRDHARLAAVIADLEVSQARERAKATRLAATLSGMTDGLMMLDPDLRMTEWNARFPEFSGVPPEILRVGLSMEEMVRAQAIAGEFGPVDVEQEVAERMAVLRAGGGVGTYERQRPDGRALEIRRNPLPGGGYVTLYTDITARRQAEERARRTQTLAAVGRLTSGVAHDFNNLLVSITGNAELIHRNGSGDPTLTRRAAVILQAAGRGADLVRQLLAFARKQELSPKDVDLNSVVHGIGELLRTTLGGMVRVEANLPPDLWPALVDPVQIEHVLLNLAVNARDAMPEGGTLTITTANARPTGKESGLELPPGDYVMIQVADTGTGMTEEVLRNAFEPFFTTKGPGRGSGLGLSQVYGLVTQSGGGVQIDSRLGRGTTVRLYFPRAPIAECRREPEREAGAAAAEISLPAQPIPPGCTTVLLVDDDENVRATIASMLTVAGYLVVTANGGADALRQIKAALHFDILLVDYAMPDMNGQEVARSARAVYPSLPVVFITGYGDEDLAAEECWVLRKPFLSRTLAQTLRGALAQAPRATQPVTHDI